LFVIAWVVAVGVTTGRQFHEWWRDEPDVVAIPPADLGEELMTRPLDITVGPAGVSLHREPFEGTHDETLRRLAKLLQQRGPSMPEPPTSIDESERALLDALEKAVPIPSATGAQLFALPAPIPAVVLTRAARGEAGPQRLIAQAFAMPIGPRRWTLFVIPVGRSGARSDWPASATVVLSWSDAAGNAVAALHGDRPLREVLAEFDRRYGEGRSVFRDVRADAATVRYRTDHETIDVRLQPDRDRGWHGVVWTSPTAP
jgi:hypothetical protein